VLAVVHHSQRRAVAGGKALRGPAAGHAVPPGIENCRGTAPVLYGMLPLPAEIAPREGRAKADGDLAPRLQFLFGDACPAHPVRDQSFHIEDGRDEQRPAKRRSRKGQHGEMRSDAVGPQADFTPPRLHEFQHGLQLRHRRPGVEAVCFPSARAMLRQIGGQHLKPLPADNLGKRRALLLAAALAVNKKINTVGRLAIQHGGDAADQKRLFRHLHPRFPGPGSGVMGSRISTTVRTSSLFSISRI